MRIALTHLRTAILFFSPMVSDSQRTRVRAELKWLNAHLGVMRDLDVAIERLQGGRQAAAASHRLHDRPGTRSARTPIERLARALRSARYRRLVKSASDWIEHGPWSIRKGKQAARERASPVAAYGLRQTDAVASKSF